MLIFLLFTVSAQIHADPYRLNPGDRLHVSVWGEENLQSDVRILPDGSISIPLVGILHVSGMTLEMVTQRIRNLLEPYIPDASVTVTVTETGGNLVYVLGKVTNPGVYPLIRRTDVLQALSLAGGLARFAKEDEIRILRRVNGKPIAIPFDFAQILRGNSLESNILLQSGDTIIVP